MDIRRLLGEVQKLKRQAEQIRDELEKIEAEGTAQGGGVRIRMNGVQQVLEVKIDPSLVQAGNAPVLESLIQQAFQNAEERIQKIHRQKLQGLGGGNLPFFR